jgi:hypothetical protein
LYFVSVSGGPFLVIFVVGEIDIQLVFSHWVRTDGRTVCV